MTEDTQHDLQSMLAFCKEGGALRVSDQTFSSGFHQLLMHQLSDQTKGLESYVAHAAASPPAPGWEVYVDSMASEYDDQGQLSGSNEQVPEEQL